jgi:Tfp pilus assembly protein PilO
MYLPLKRIFDEKRRLMIPLVAGLAVNIVLYTAVVYPMSARAGNAQSRADAADLALQAAERDDAAARGIAEGRDRTDVALKVFYKDVLPQSLPEAQQATFLRLAELAERHNLRRSRTNRLQGTDAKSSLVHIRISTLLQGDYDDLRRFIYDVESGTDFIVIDSIALRQGSDADSALTLELTLSTYYRARPGGA